jgi:glycosyltransferase involved in cell wall biosynthesis
MKVLVFHGYLLRGTGSNVYNASLAQTLARLGHEVHLLCQDRGAAELPWVGGDGPGSVTVHVPDIGGLLPVYVADHYEGFEVKTFPELSDAELERYLDLNVAAVKAVAADHGPFDAALANHLVMGPAILARAGLEFATKVHGSDLSYTVRPHPERFVPLAREGTDAASGLLVGSRHTAEDLFTTVGDPALPERTRLGPPGVDVERFRPASRADADERARALASRLASDGERSFGRDAPAAAEAIESWLESEPRVLFVGKLLVNKGVDLLAEAWTAVVREHPGARLLFAGFGEFADELRAQVAALPEEVARSVSISGRLEHDEVADVMPAADVFTMPSVFPEAFGMVAAEAAACGVPPVSAGHSGMREVSSRLAEAAGPELAPLLSFEVDGDAAGQLAARINGWLALDPADRERAGQGLAEKVASLWSWENVANGVLAASRGELDALPRLASD